MHELLTNISPMRPADSAGPRTPLPPTPYPLLRDRDNKALIAFSRFLLASTLRPPRPFQMPPPPSYRSDSAISTSDPPAAAADAGARTPLSPVLQ